MLEITVPMLAAALVNMVMGFLWYGPLLFAKPWLKLIGKKEADLKKAGLIKPYLLQALSSLVVAYIMSHTLAAFASKTWQDGANLAFWLWLGFVVTTSSGDYLFSGRPRQLYLINMGYQLISFLMMGVILTVWH